MAMMMHKLKQTQRIHHGIASAPHGMVAGNRDHGASQHKPSRLLVHLRQMSLLVGLTLATAVAGCGVPALTSNVLSGNATNSYLDIVQHANPESVGPTANALKRIIAKRGDDTTDRLIARVSEAQGSCDRSSATVRCIIDKSIVERNCFQGRCGDSRKRWTLTISWRDAPGTIDPQVSLKISWPEKL